METARLANHDLPLIHLFQGSLNLHPLVQVPHKFLKENKQKKRTLSLVYETKHQNISDFSNPLSISSLYHVFSKRSNNINENDRLHSSFHRRFD